MRPWVIIDLHNNSILQGHNAMCLGKYFAVYELKLFFIFLPKIFLGVSKEVMLFGRHLWWFCQFLSWPGHCHDYGNHSAVQAYPYPQKQLSCSCAFSAKHICNVRLLVVPWRLYWWLFASKMCSPPCFAWLYLAGYGGCIAIYYAAKSKTCYIRQSQNTNEM